MERVRESLHPYWLPGLTALMLLFSAISSCSTVSSDNQRLQVTNYPILTPDAVWERFDELDNLVRQKTSGIPDEYYQTRRDIREMELTAFRIDAFQGLDAVDSKDRPVRMLPLVSGRLKNQLIQNIERFGIRELSNEQKGLLIDRYELPNYPPAPGAKSTIMPFVWLLLYIGLFAMPQFYVIRLWQKRLLSFKEIPYILLWSVPYPVGIFKYPNHDLVEQAKRWKQAVTASVAGLLGLAPVSMAHAKVGGKVGGIETEQVDQGGLQV